MNHRELILSARKKARFAFLSLPEDLQDEIVEGLDGQTLTLLDASELCAARGLSLSHEAIAGYYRAVRTERRILEANQELTRVIAEFAGKPQKEALEGLVNLVIATAASGLADGSVGIKDVDLAKLVEATRRARGDGREATDDEKPEPPCGETVIDADRIREIRERYL